VRSTSDKGVYFLERLPVSQDLPPDFRHRTRDQALIFPPSVFSSSLLHFPYSKYRTLFTPIAVFPTLAPPTLHRSSVHRPRKESRLDFSFCFWSFWFFVLLSMDSLVQFDASFSGPLAAPNSSSSLAELPPLPFFFLGPYPMAAFSLL